MRLGIMTLTMMQRLGIKRLSYGVAEAHPTHKMRAVVYSQPGEAEVLACTSTAKPVPAQGQLLVKVAASGVNPVDCKLRANTIASLFRPLPKIVGGDFSGEVVEAPSGSPFSAGDHVFGLAPLIGQSWGTCAEYLVVDESLAAPVPEGLDLVEAAALPLVALTIIQAMEPVVRALGGIGGGEGGSGGGGGGGGGGGTAGKTVLVHAGAGGLGTFAVQYCKHVLGMWVAATCGAGNLDLVKGLGADLVIDYRVQTFEDVCLQDQPDGYDVVIDPLAYTYRARSLRVLKQRGGHYVHIASSPWVAGGGDKDPLGLAIPEARPERMIGGVIRTAWGNVRRRVLGGATMHGPVFVHPSGEDLAPLAAAVAGGQIKAVVERRFRMEEAAEAHRHIEDGHTRGKVVIVV